MIQYNALLNLKLSNLQLKLKSGIKSGTQVILNLPSNMIGNSNDNTNFPHQLLLANTQVSRLCKTFANGSSDNIKLSKSQLFKMVQLERFLGRPLGPLLKCSNVIRINDSSSSNRCSFSKKWGSGMIILNEEILMVT